MFYKKKLTDTFNRGRLTIRFGTASFIVRMNAGLQKSLSFNQKSLDGKT
jgi:hypothetical protein